MMHGSFYSSAIDEFQSPVHNRGRSLGSMNLDELLTNIWNSDLNQQTQQQSLGNMTLEEFLVQAEVEDKVPLNGNVYESEKDTLGYEFKMGLVSNPLLDDRGTLFNSPIGSMNGKRGLDVAENVGKRGLDVAENVAETRQKRMMKNRESAARSRARKQAYTMQLETELHRLRKENKELHEKQKMLEVEVNLDGQVAGVHKGVKRLQLRRTMSTPW